MHRHFPSVFYIWALQNMALKTVLILLKSVLETVFKIW